MLILIEIWNRRYQQIQIVRTAFWLCHDIYTNIKKNKGIKSCLIPEPLLSTPACHSFPLLITLYTFYNTSNESNPQ